MVIRLAESLDLPLRERNDLLFAGGYAPAYSETKLDDPRLATVLDAMRHVLNGHLPYPAIVIDGLGTLIAANRAFEILIDGVEPTLREPPVNVFRLALQPHGMAPRIRNRAQLVQHMRMALRRRLLRDPTPELESLLAELDLLTPNNDDEPPRDGVGFVVPLRLDSPVGTLELITTISVFATAVDVTVADLQLEAFLPADQATAIKLMDLYDQHR